MSCSHIWHIHTSHAQIPCTSIHKHSTYTNVHKHYTHRLLCAQLKAPAWWELLRNRPKAAALQTPSAPFQIGWRSRAPTLCRALCQTHPCLLYGSFGTKQKESGLITDAPLPFTLASNIGLSSKVFPNAPLAQIKECFTFVCSKQCQFGG